MGNHHLFQRHTAQDLFLVVVLALWSSVSLWGISLTSSLAPRLSLGGKKQGGDEQMRMKSCEDVKMLITAD